MVDFTQQNIRKKLIEVSIPLEAINVASAKEKSIRHGHPSTLHLWWSRKPLATCRAVLFAQLVDDPSSWPDRFKTEAEQDIERRRLHQIIQRMLPWEALNDEAVLNDARWEIARSVAWGRGEEPPLKSDGRAVERYLQDIAPPVYDPFCGGGSIPLEAQRLGLRAYGSDLNPVAVLISKALVEIPPLFAGRAPINPVSKSEFKRGGRWNGKGAAGLAEDIRYYGHWMREEAERRIGHHYPKVALADGTLATVVAWLWARTVRSPDPIASGHAVPLVSSFLLSTKDRAKAWIEPKLDASAPDGYRFEVHSGPMTKADEERLAKGTKTGRGEFRCVLTGAKIDSAHIKSEAKAGRMSMRLMAIVAEGKRGRVFLSPNEVHEAAAIVPTPDVTFIAQDMLHDPRALTPVLYDIDRLDKLFSPRQLLALSTYSDLVAEARLKVIEDARGEAFPAAGPLCARGQGILAYADAIATYLGLGVGRLADIQNAICRWEVTKTQVRNLFGRAVIPMAWEFAENCLFNNAAGDFKTSLDNLVKALKSAPAAGHGYITQLNASKNSFPIRPIVVSTDPPYYDNVGYADLSDFFYVWLRRTLHSVWPDLFRRITTPKEGELVATPYRHGGKAAAEQYFMLGMAEALTALKEAATETEPLAIYYAFKQSELAAEGITSSGWSSFLQAVIGAGLVVDGTWPMRTELANRVRSIESNALASSIVLVCRKRSALADVISRAEFVRALKRELPDAIDEIRKAGVGPVDMQQSVIGPGMGIFSRYARILEDDDSSMPVKVALALINRVWEEIDQELDAAFDAETQVALAWFATYGFDARPSGELITLANAKNIASDALFDSGVFIDLKGKAALTPRDQLSKDWAPSLDATFTVWECVQHTAKTLNAEDGGGVAASRLVALMGPKAAEARTLAYRLFEIATQKGWAAEALIYNELAQEWPKLEDLASTADARASIAAAQAELF
ncbi:DUF1156 domain-containing protein [Bradyrhizobium sp. SZCCHNR1098]|uniref:DUF1156 domain-containing protein n=1 Tax=Bradyrhizobium sp. SZCCHNR1098 TaxID=3057370 RepID=UPI0029168C6A|nr:DUF1156 domain-containing protein [Bradyrhizobium sp. SZCCHNR1098]